jgi:transcriptional regulator with XRE-family HTH domain
VRTYSRFGALTASEDARLGETLKAIRRRSALTQVAVAEMAGVPVRDVIAIEAGRGGEARLDRIRSIFETLDGRTRLAVWWHGAAADRILDDRHAGLVEAALRVLRKRGWETAAEVTFSQYGERGSIDILAGFMATHAIAVGEVKGSVGSIEEMNRTLDMKERLAPALARERFGWYPLIVGRLLIFPEDRTTRRVIERHAVTMATVYPARGREVRAWLHQPDRPLRGVWFLSDLRNTQPVVGR